MKITCYKALAYGATLLFVVPHFAHAGSFTLPVDISSTTDITSWFDHDAPDNTANGDMVRYDGMVYTGAAASLHDCVDGIGCYDGHNGVDFATTTGVDVMAAADGEVENVYWNDCGGWTMRLWHNDIGLSTLYAHVGTTTVATTSDAVDRYEPIATVNSTGSCAKGVHLHFGVADGNSLSSDRIDPFGWTGTTTDPWPYDQGNLWTTDPPSLYAPPELLRGLVSVWLSDSSGLASDLVGSNTLTDHNTVTLLSNGGKNGDAASFVRANSEDLDDTAASGWHSGKESFSYSGWFKVPTVGSGDADTILGSSISGTGSRYFTEVQLNAGGTLEFETAWVNGGNQGVDLYSTASGLDDNAWHQFVVVAKNWNGAANEELYIDGTLDATTSGSQEYDFGSNLSRITIGSTYNWLYGTTEHYLNGIVHQAAVWDRALTPAEVAALYASGSGIPYSSF